MLKLENISKRFGSFKLSDINLSIGEGEYYVLLGKSGSGKTLLLELIAGLSKPDIGLVWLDNENITNRRIQDRNTGLVFQDYAIFPNMTVYGNIAYPLVAKRIDKASLRSKVNIIAEEMDIGHLLDRSTQNLSGGEMQRVALARTLVTEPKLLLLDEPMASIDASLRDEIKRVLRQLNKKGHTIIHVTHDYREAIHLASRVGVIHGGRIIQEGPPNKVFRNPVNRFVARYAGIRNFFRVSVLREDGRWKAVCDNKLVFNMSENNYEGDGIIIVRNEDIEISKERPAGKCDNCFKGTVTDIIPSVYGMEILVDAGEKFCVEIRQERFDDLLIKELSDVWISFPASAALLLNEDDLTAS